MATTRLSLWSLGAIVWMVAGCVRAQFVPVDGLDSGPDARGDAGRDVDASSCMNATTPAPGCQSKIDGGCDPVCQAGPCAWCGEKCSLNNVGVPTCVARGSIETGRECTVLLEGTAQQRDECQAGAICLAPNVGGAASFCFALCRSSVDCPGNVACAARPLGRGAVAQVCDPEYTTCDPALRPGCCDPLAADPTANGCGDGRFCYLVTPDPAGHSRTMCEYATGGKGKGEACLSSRECLEKYACVPTGTGGGGVCQRVCSGSNPCSGSACVPLGSEFGTCPV